MWTHSILSREAPEMDIPTSHPSCPFRSWGCHPNQSQRPRELVGAPQPLRPRVGREKRGPGIRREHMVGPGEEKQNGVGGAQTTVQKQDLCIYTRGHVRAYAKCFGRMLMKKNMAKGVSENLEHCINMFISPYVQECPCCVCLAKIKCSQTSCALLCINSKS